MTDPSGMLEMWCVYDHPTDFPDQFIARRWLVSDEGPLATLDIRLGDTLQEVRDQLPLGLRRIARGIDDDPAVVETWL